MLLRLICEQSHTRSPLRRKEARSPRDRYYEPDGRLLYAGRVGTGMSVRTLAMLHQRLKPLEIPKMALAVAPPRKTRFGGPLALSKVHWVRLELVAEITYLSWSEDGLLRHTVFVGLREDKPASEVRREGLGL